MKKCIKKFPKIFSKNIFQKACQKIFQKFVKGIVKKYLRNIVFKKTSKKSSKASWNSFVFGLDFHLLFKSCTSYCLHEYYKLCKLKLVSGPLFLKVHMYRKIRKLHYLISIVHKYLAWLYHNVLRIKVCDKVRRIKLRNF